MTEETLHPEESFKLINSMISTAKNKLANDGFHIIFWGWLITVCALTHYITLKLDLQWGNWVWVILPPAGGIFSAFYGYRQKRTKQVKTYVDTYLGYLWRAFIIGMFITLIFLPHFGIKQTYFSLMILYGIATFISGGILSFKPLVIGGLLSFAFAVLSVFFGDTEQLLCISGALICSYIVPGHLLRSKFKSQHV